MQASFKLSWGCKGQQANDQHKKEIVSFESGNITTADRSSKQVWTIVSNAAAVLPESYAFVLSSLHTC